MASCAVNVRLWPAIMLPSKTLLPSADTLTEVSLPASTLSSSPGNPVPDGLGEAASGAEVVLAAFSAEGFGLAPSGRAATGTADGALLRSFVAWPIVL